MQTCGAQVRGPSTEQSSLPHGRLDSLWGLAQGVASERMQSVARLRQDPDGTVTPPSVTRRYTSQSPVPELPPVHVAPSFRGRMGSSG